jgi:glycerophosphoryl diester phosphodiesterase
MSSTDPRRSARPLIFAHRGSSDLRPEHTLAAYSHAIEEGADGVECDVRLTRDGHLVCVHDRRLDRTSDGRGLVRRRTLAELQRLDFGSWHSQAAELLTLEALLGMVRDAGRPVRLLIETKHPSRGGRHIEQRLAEILRRFGLDRPAPDDPGGVTVMSFSPLALRRVRELTPAVSTVMLMEVLPPGLRTGRLPFGSRIGGPGIRLLRVHPELATRLHANGHQVYVWTVNEPPDVDLVLRLGVEAVITDRPGYMLGRIADARPGDAPLADALRVDAPLADIRGDDSARGAADSPHGGHR